MHSLSPSLFRSFSFLPFSFFPFVTQIIRNVLLVPLGYLPWVSVVGFFHREETKLQMCGLDNILWPNRAFLAEFTLPLCNTQLNPCLINMDGPCGFLGQVENTSSQKDDCSKQRCKEVNTTFILCVCSVKKCFFNLEPGIIHVEQIQTHQSPETKPLKPISKLLNKK